jgi:uncharacterized Rossmann fold enzyme
MGVVYQVTVIIPGIRDPGQHQLLTIIEAGDACCFAFGLRQCRKEHASQYGDDGNDYQQFNERKSVFVVFSHGDERLRMSKENAIIKLVMQTFFRCFSAVSPG